MSVFTLESDLRKAKADWDKARAYLDDCIKRRDLKRIRFARVAYDEAWSHYEVAADALAAVLPPAGVRS